MSLATRIDEIARSPSIKWKPLLSAFIIGHALFDLVINVLEYGVQCRKDPPKAVSEQIKVDHKEFVKSQDYTKAKLRVSIFSDLYETAINIYMLKHNVLAKFFYFFQPIVYKSLPTKYFGEGFVAVLATLGIMGIGILLSIPIKLYSTFVVEEQFGFNKMTLKLFFTDMVKETLIGALVMPLVLLGIQKIIEFTGDHFVLYIGGFMVLLGILAQFLVPTVIMPLFKKYEPLEEGELRTKINDLAKKLNFPLKNLYVEDGSTRSAHSNAYFVGLPWYKQIVIYDTLINQLTTDQIVAVIGHELGHWKHTHIPILMATGALQTILVFAPLSFFLSNKTFFEQLGFSPEMPILVAVALFSDILTPLQLTLTFCTNYITRLCEYDADRFAVKLGYAEHISAGLAALSKKNLSALDQQPLYSNYHNSHPRTSERLDAIRNLVKKKE